jgi:signal transduction histidine kinase
VRLMPRSLFGRLVLVMTAGLLVAQLISITLHLTERQRTVARTASEEIAQRIAAIYRALDSQTGAQREHLATLLSSASLAASVEPAGSAMAIDTDDSLAFLVILRQALGPDVQVDARSMPRLGVIALDLRLRLIDGEWLHMRGGAPRELFAWPTHLFINLAVMFLTLAALSWFAVRAATRPLGDLAQAARGLGHDLNRIPLPETGPAEVAEAAREFNAMQARLRESIEERANFLAAVSHDLKTPITRLRLRAEMLGDSPLREKFASDLKEMEDMVSAALGFLRGETVAEPLRPVAITALAESVVDDFVEGGSRLSIDCTADFRIPARPHALRRCLTNLIDNALKYGVDDVEVAIEAVSDGLDILVRDRGPGLNSDDLEKVFEPFYRVENSRNRETGGTGLGLSIARQIARAHGGELTVVNRSGGGLEARLHLPRNNNS